MSCYYPMCAVLTGERSEKGKLKYKITGRYDPIIHEIDPTAIKVPCGNCIGCRLDKSREWADRMLLELDHTHKGVFITLTMRDADIQRNLCMIDEDENPHYTLFKEDMQKFMKDLRGRKEFENKEIRFYGCGEYGSKGRPHYHIVLFGVGLNDFGRLEVVGKNEFGDIYYRSKLLDDIWKRGITCLCNVSWKTCAYVARYVTKKINGPNSPYAEENKLSEFALMSRRPGIAGYYLSDHDFDFDVSRISLNDGSEQKTISVPKYFLKKLESMDPEKYNELKRQRKKFADDRELLKLQNTDLDFDSLTGLELEKIERSSSTLIRSFERIT